MLVRVFYVSRIVEPLSEVDLKIVLGACGVNNRRFDVTEMLVRSSHHFCQVLEGRPGSVAEVMKRIRRSQHHSALRVLLEEPVSQRAFAEWAMSAAYRHDLSTDLATLHETGNLTPLSAHAAMRRVMGADGRLPNEHESIHRARTSQFHPDDK